MEVEITGAKLRRANELITGLSDEGERWEAKVEEIKLKQKYIVGHYYIAASIIQY